jgi:hypothetical protein
MNGAVMTLARWHAKEAVKKELYAQGIKLRQVEACEIARAAIQYIDDHPEIIAKAFESYRRLIATGRLRPPRKLKLLCTTEEICTTKEAVICKDFRCANLMNEMKRKAIRGPWKFPLHGGQNDHWLCPS